MIHIRSEKKQRMDAELESCDGIDMEKPPPTRSSNTYTATDISVTHTNDPGDDAQSESEYDWNQNAQPDPAV